MHIKILQIAIPAIISNITVPLLGLVDVTIVGHLGSASYIGAIAVGGMLFSLIYWVFAFLRMGTSGMTAQAWGRKDFDEVGRLLVRSLTLAFVVGMVLIVLQKPLLAIAFSFIDASGSVRQLASIYFKICIWGAPAALGLFSLSGWFVGAQNSKTPMWVAIIQNIVNIVVSVTLVALCGMKVEGVALGTLIAQYTGLFLGLLMFARNYEDIRRHLEPSRSFGKSEMMRFFTVNRDIFLRMLCLVAVTVYFTSAGAAGGDTILAANTLLMQFFTLFSYFMDGFAYSGEALCGKNFGEKKMPELKQVVRCLFVWGTALGMLVSVLYCVLGNIFVGLLTNEPVVGECASHYIYWVWAIPVLSFAAFLFDGIFIGMTASKGMLQSMFVAMLCFFAIVLVRNSMFADDGMASESNHMLWMAFDAYLLVRGIIQLLIYKLRLSKCA